jgi:hypothetical protein
VQITAASEPGSLDKPTEDSVIVTTDMAAVLDGATVRTDTVCIHGVPWFVENLSSVLVMYAERSPADALTAPITETAVAHSETCDLAHPATPSAAMAIAQARRDCLRYLVFGDATLAIETTDGLQIITDDRVGRTALAERAVANALPTGSPEKTDALVRMKHGELTARNVPGGFWIAAASPEAVSHSLTGQIPLNIVRQVIPLTDGAARAVKPFNLYDWPGVFSLVAREGPSGLIKRARAAEDADPVASHHPRNKIHDDASVVSIDL